MGYQMFIDDERFPVEDCDSRGAPWVIARSLDAVRDAVIKRGPPDFISFDHDLGHGVPSGQDIAWAMVSADLITRHGRSGDPTDARACGFDDAEFRFPEKFTFTVHSMNCVGGPNIRAVLDGYLRSLGRDI